MTRLADALARKILVLDGAMGTMIQAAGLGAADFGGERYEGCNEHLNVTRPDVIRDIHAAYLDAGADVVSTNTFGCAPYVLAEYGLADRAHALSLAAARLAREAAGDRFVVGAMGPSTRCCWRPRRTPSISRRRPSVCAARRARRTGPTSRSW